MAQAKTGTHEWAVANVNCLNGCEHACRYCYARHYALKSKRISKPEEWATTYVGIRQYDVQKPRHKMNGPVMFPSTHDITPRFLEPCLVVLEKLLKAGNQVVVVSKPHFDVIRRLCSELARFKGQITFRFTIGAVDDELLSYWEPGAPTYSERFATLMGCYMTGWQTSVSAEPLLDSAHVEQLVDAVDHFVSETIWIGKMRDVRRRVIPGTDEAAIAAIERGQTEEAVRRVYEKLKHRPKIAWKDSYRQALGLD